MKEQLIVAGKEADPDLKKLASSLGVGEKLSGHYRYFLFGSKPCSLPFELKRVSDRLAVMNHLNKDHKVRLSA